MYSDFVPKEMQNCQAPVKRKMRITTESMDGSVYVEVGSQ
jgi:hypothetical protein